MHYIRQLRGWGEKLVEPLLSPQLSSAAYFDSFKSGEFNVAKIILIHSSPVLHSSVFRERNRIVSYRLLVVKLTVFFSNLTFSKFF